MLGRRRKTLVQHQTNIEQKLCVFLSVSSDCKPNRGFSVMRCGVHDNDIIYPCGPPTSHLWQTTNDKIGTRTDPRWIRDTTCCSSIVLMLGQRLKQWYDLGAAFLVHWDSVDPRLMTVKLLYIISVHNLLSLMVLRFWLRTLDAPCFITKLLFMLKRDLKRHCPNTIVTAIIDLFEKNRKNIAYLKIRKYTDVPYVSVQNQDWLAVWINHPVPLVYPQVIPHN